MYLHYVQYLDEWRTLIGMFVNTDKLKTRLVFSYAIRMIDEAFLRGARRTFSNHLAIINMPLDEWLSFAPHSGPQIRPYIESPFGDKYTIVVNSGNHLGTFL